MDHGVQAAELFLQGYNCAQAVVVAFCDVTGLEPKLAARLSSSFGGGVGRMREICGAVSGMAAVLGLLYGYDSMHDDQTKQAHYARVQELAQQFRAQFGSIVCRELLENPSTDPTPSPRTQKYYQERPCAGYVHLAGELLDAYIEAHPLENVPCEN